jgi:hypothetical protein
LEANLASEEKIDNRRFLRRLQQEQQEKQMNESITKVTVLENYMQWNDIGSSFV